MNRIPPAVKNLLIINVLFFMGALALEKYGIDLHGMLGLHFFMAPHFHIYQLVTYMFLHDGFQHIFFNMFALWMFGRIMEAEWGTRRFLFFYLACGIGAGLFQEVTQFIHYMIAYSGYDAVQISNTGITIPMNTFLDRMLTVGASGAVYGILIGYGMTYPDHEILIFPIPMPIKAKWMVAGYAVLELVLGLGNNAADNVAHFAHLGGMLIGFLIIMYWRKKDRRDNHIKFTY